MGSSGGIEGEFSAPSGLGLDSQGNLYVADMGNHRVVKFAPDGVPMGVLGGPRGSNPSELSGPCGVAVDALGKVYAVEKFNNRIYVFAPIVQP